MGGLAMAAAGGGGLGFLGGGGSGGALDTLTGGGKAANKANLKNVDYIKALFGEAMSKGQEGYKQALGQLDKAGDSAKTDTLSQEKQFLAGSSQNLANSGLYGSTVQNAAARGIHSDAMRSLGSIDSQIANMRAGLLTGQANFGLRGAEGLGGILGNVQHKPGTDYLGKLLGGLGSLAGGMG